MERTIVTGRKAAAPLALLLLTLSAACSTGTPGMALDGGLGDTAVVPDTQPIDVPRVDVPAVPDVPSDLPADSIAPDVPAPTDVPVDEPQPVDGPIDAPATDLTGDAVVATWPTCDEQPAGVPSATLNQIWQANPAQPTAYWVPGVFVTGVYRAGCTTGVACQIFVQQAEQFASLAAGSQQALKVFISAATARYFTGIAVGDRVDVYAHAWRYNVSGQRELLLQVNSQLVGCAKVVGQGAPLPVTATLADLTLAAYEDTLGPLLVKVDTVSGRPQGASEIFGLFETGVFNDGGVDEITSLSPSFLAGGAFTGLTAGSIHDFTSVTGVFGLFSPTSDPTAKFKEIYPRTTAEYPVAQVR